MARLFFALWPDAAAGARLAALATDVAAACDGRPMPREKIHLTLAFLGEVPAERHAALLDAAACVGAGDFNLYLDRLGSFRRARVAWAGASEVPSRLVALQSALAARLGDAGFALEDRPYAPHVTLARDIRRAPAGSLEPVGWNVARLHLVRSEPGRYVNVGEWPLR